MATFITTLKFTQQGVKGIDESVRRAGQFKSDCKKLGVKVKEVYWTLGEYDGLIIFEAADCETATTAVLHLAALGNVHPTTVRAFNASDMEKVLTKVHTG